MSSAPPRWTHDELRADAAESASLFRRQRLTETQQWSARFVESKEKFERVFALCFPVAAAAGAGTLLDDPMLLRVQELGLGEALRYAAGPPVSEDDLRTLAEVDTLSPKRLAADPAALQRIRQVLIELLDPHRFPWVREQRNPSASERSAALLASSVLLAAQRTETDRRMLAKEGQEDRVRAFLRNLGLREVSPAPITTLVNGPQRGEFCSECLLGERKADIVVRLHDTRLMAIECKVSNSALNSVKRLNNDAAAKAGHWLEQFGRVQVVPCAVLSGVFKVLNLEQAQRADLTLFWAHQLDRLGQFIAITQAP